MACEFQVSSVFAPTSGLRVAGTSQTGGRRQGRVPPLAKLDFLQRRRSRIVWASPSTGHAGMGREGWPARFHSKLTLETLPSGQRGGVTVPARHFFSETLRLPGTGIATMRPEPLCWPICCRCWGPCSPILGLCWGYVATSWPPVGPCCGRCWTVRYPRGDLGLCCFHDFTFIPKILLEKALPSGLRGTHFIFATLFL